MGKDYWRVVAVAPLPPAMPNVTFTEDDGGIE